MSQRQNKQLLNFYTRLDEEVEKGVELFFRQRPFMENPNAPRLILDATHEDIEEKICNDFAVTLLIKKITDLTQTL